MKKMAELQLSIVSDPKNRKAIENQVLPISTSLFGYMKQFIITEILLLWAQILMLSRLILKCSLGFKRQNWEIASSHRMP